MQLGLPRATESRAIYKQEESVLEPEKEAPSSAVSCSVPLKPSLYKAKY